MNGLSRARFILLVTASYVVLALAWIFLSDRVLSLIADRETLLSLSVAKGVFFVLASGTMFFFSLRAVPAAGTTQAEPVMNALARTAAPDWRWRTGMYLFAFAVSAAAVVMYGYMQVALDDRPLVVIFMLPIILSALMGGVGPGLLATATAVIGVNVLGAPSVFSAAADSVEQFRWSVLVVNGVAVSLLSQMLRSSLARLELSRGQLDAVVSGTTDAVFVKDLQGRYLFANAAAGSISKISPEQMIGQGDSCVFDAASAADLARIDQAVMASARVQTLEEHLTTRDGQKLVFLATKGPVYDGHKNVVGLFGISRDITAQRQAEQLIQGREQRLTRVIEGADQGYWDWNLQNETIQVSRRWEAMLDYGPGEIDASPKNWVHLVHPDDLPLAQAAVQSHMSGEIPYLEVEVRCRTRGGDWRWVMSRGRIVERDDDGNPIVMSGTHTDIHERKLNEIAQREATVVFECSHEGIMVVSPEELITKVNPGFTRITGYSAAEVVGKSPGMLASGVHGGAFYEEMWRSLREQGFWRGEIWDRRKNGETYAQLLSISVVRDEQARVQHYIAVFSDISQIKAHEAELDRVAHYDPLTGLPNRRLLSDRLGQSILRSTRSGKSSAVCFLDLDGFKAVNDEHGHSMGDALLIGVTDHLKTVLRADDTLARLGGDEFVLILSEVASADECSLILDRVLDAACMPVEVGGVSITVSASIGATLYPADNVDADTLLRHADQAMYMAKEAGKNRYQLFDPESDRKAQTHRHFVELLRHALERQEFVLFYQPKVDLVDGNIVGAEALIRWQHPERGLLSPAEFLPHVYGSELERSFGEWVILTALAQMSQWVLAGLNLQISVNVSANHLLQAGFSEHLAAALARHPDVIPARFELEVLETAAIGDMHQAVDVLTRCKALGVQFSLDDFGTGYSSLTYLRKLPVDTLKIDQSFVRDMLSNADDLGIIEGVIKLASVFNRQVIAEGVETMAHGAALRRMGCRLVQGYGIARPMPAEQLRDWCLDWQRKQLWLESGVTT